MFGNSLFLSRKVVESFTTKCAVTRQIKPRIFELSVRSQSNFGIVSIYCWLVSIRSYYGHSHRRRKANQIFAFFFCCLVVRYNKTLNDCPLWASARRTLRVSVKQSSLFPMGPVIKCLMSIKILVFEKMIIYLFQTKGRRIFKCARTFYLRIF